MAVVLGVAPLLLINVLYTIHFYIANALTGTAWILLVPGIAVRARPGERQHSPPPGCWRRSGSSLSDLL